MVLYTSAKTLYSKTSPGLIDLNRSIFARTYSPSINAEHLILAKNRWRVNITSNRWIAYLPRSKKQHLFEKFMQTWAVRSYLLDVLHETNYCHFNERIATRTDCGDVAVVESALKISRLVILVEAIVDASSIFCR